MVLNAAFLKLNFEKFYFLNYFHKSNIYLAVQNTIELK